MKKMKISELKEIAKKNGYELSFEGLNFTIVLKRDTLLGCNKITIGRKIKNRLWIRSCGYTDDDDMRMMEAAMAYAKTPPDDRAEEKRYIVPLPGLITTDGEQQYLTQISKNWFACRRKKDLRQTWKEKHLCYVPEQYRGYAVEVEE